MRIIKIGSIVLDNVMWVTEGLDSDGVFTEVVNNLDGGIIIFEQATKVSKKNMTLLSKDNGWQSETTAQAILDLANGSLGVSTTIEDDYGSVYGVRFRHEQKGGAVQLDRLVEAKLSEWFTGTIYMARV